jgi:hypothetical protein
MADIDIVAPVEGARRVDFDYAAASAAIDALETMTGKLSGQAEGRLGPRDTVVVGWQGPFREEFDRAWGLLDARLSTAADAAGSQKGAIYGAIEDANDQQRRYNQIAEEERARRLIEAAGASPV